MNKYAMDNVTTYPLSTRLLCNNSNAACLELASLNECEANLHFMMTACPLACRVCDKRLLYDTCRNDNPTNPWLPENGFKQLFEHLKSQKHAELLTVDGIKDLDSPWVLKWDDFVSSNEVSALLTLAKSLTWEVSTPVVSTNHNRVRRLSRSAYCKDCPEEQQPQQWCLYETSTVSFQSCPGGSKVHGTIRIRSLPKDAVVWVHITTCHSMICGCQQVLVFSVSFCVFRMCPRVVPWAFRTWIGCPSPPRRDNCLFGPMS
jgi:hypothetical protein